MSISCSIIIVTKNLNSANLRNMNIALIAVAYNRVDSLRRLLSSLEKAFYPSTTTLIISIDKSKTDVVENFADEYKWQFGEKRVVKHEKNLGLRAHMLSLGKYLEEYDAIVVLEDDVTVASSFMYYVNSCVKKYYDDEHIAGISLYSYHLNYSNQQPWNPAKSAHDVYMMQVAMSWGQVWMRDSWKAFYKWYEENKDLPASVAVPAEVKSWPKSSWLKYHIRYCIETNKYFVYPYYALSTNNADVGVNYKIHNTLYQSALQTLVQKEYKLPDFDECEVKYDGYFEPMYLAKYLGLAAESVCVDIYGIKPVELYQRYVLTLRSLPYKVVKSFALEYRPIEMNIIADREGNDIFLYDTTVAATAPMQPDTYNFYNYLYPKGFYNSLFIMGFKRVFKLVVDLLVYKFNKIFHTNLPCNIK